MQFSTHVIDALKSTIVGSIGSYRTGSEIVRFMKGCGFEFSLNGYSRETAVHKYLCDLNSDYEKMKIVIESVSDPRGYDNYETSQKVLDYLNIRLIPENHIIKLDNGRTVLSKIENDNSLIIYEYDIDTVLKENERIKKNLDSDPEDAITSACSLVESMCKSIIHEMNIPLPSDKTIKGLFKAVQEPLGISPKKNDKYSESINECIRTILNSLSTCVQGIGNLRTNFGDAHGREKNFPRIDVRIARLAINSANTISIFLIETWENKMKRKLANNLYKKTN